MDYFSVFSVSSVTISFVPSWLRANQSIMQNKPNSPNPKTNATSFTAKDYRRKLPLPHSKKQTQTNPILSLGGPPAPPGKHRVSRIEHLAYLTKAINHPAPFLQNKPNSGVPGNNATSFTTSFYANISPISTRKNKPNQTQTNPQNHPLGTRPWRANFIPWGPGPIGRDFLYHFLSPRQGPLGLGDVPMCLCTFVPIPQLCKTNPIPSQPPLPPILRTTSHLSTHALMH